MKTITNTLLIAAAVVISGCFPQQQCGKATFEVKVTDFAAFPDDGKDDRAAIVAAIGACRGRQGAKLVFARGRYDIDGGPMGERRRRQPSLDIKHINNMTIEGNGAELIGHDYSTMFHFTECQNITINNLTVDWNPLPYTQGKVVEVNDEYVDIEVVAPFTAQAGRRTEAILGYDLERRRMARRYTDHYQKGYEKTSEVVRPGIMRLFIGRQDRFAGALPPVGTHIIARHQVYGYQALQFVKCSNVRIENVNIYSNPGMGVIGSICRDIFIRHLKVMLRPGSGRWMSCTADATNFPGCRGTLVIENCLFEGMGDDATNIKSGHYSVVSERVNDKTLSISRGRRGGIPPVPHIGDRLELSGEDLVPYTTVTVKSVKRNEEKEALIVEFSDKLPERAGKGDIVGNPSSCPSVHIRNCMVIRNRARGFIIKNRGAIIEDCYFQDITASAIGMNADINVWWESIGSHDIIIRNNHFVDCRFDPDVVRGIIECLTNVGERRSPPGVHQRITIENNIIQGSGADGVKIGSADGLVIADNIIDGIEDCTINIYDSRNIRITGNRVTNSSAALKTDGCETDTIKLKNNIGL